MQQTSMLKLYTGKNSICTQKVLIVLSEKGLEVESRYIDLFKNEQFSDWYLSINPKGVVPSLDHDGRIVTESTLICEYIDDMFPEPRLIPSDPYQRTRMRRWSKAVDEDLFDATRELSFSAMFRERMRNMTPAEREVRFRNVGDPVKRSRFMSTYEQGVESAYVYEGIAAFESAFDTMEAYLSTAEEGNNELWLLGSDFTLADVNMMPFVARLHYLNLLDIWLVDRPRIRKWFTRSQDRPSFKYAIPDKFEQSDLDTMYTFGTKIRDQVEAQRRKCLVGEAGKSARRGQEQK